MTPTLFPSVFTIEIGGKPTVTFEAKSLCEASEICNAPWLREDFASAHSNGAPLWDGKAELRARIGYEAEIATVSEASKDVEPSHGMLLVYLVELDDNDSAEISESSSATALRSDGKRFMRTGIRDDYGVARKKKPGTECRACDEVRIRRCGLAGAPAFGRLFCRNDVRSFAVGLGDTFVLAGREELR